MEGASHVHDEWAVQVPNTRCQRAKGEVFVVLKCYYKICHSFQGCTAEKDLNCLQTGQNKADLQLAYQLSNPPRYRSTSFSKYQT